MDSSSISEIEARETANQKALDLIQRLKDLGEIREQLLSQLDAYFQLKDCCPELLEEEGPIKTQWLGSPAKNNLRLKITNAQGKTQEIPNDHVPSIITRPEGV